VGMFEYFRKSSLFLVTSPSHLLIQELTPSLDLSNDLPGRRLPSRERCLSCRGKWHPSIWLRCRFPALYSPDVWGIGYSLGWKRIRVRESSTVACPLGLLLEGQSIKGEESLWYVQELSWKRRDCGRIRVYRYCI